MSLDPVRAIEACYAPAPDDSAWLGGIMDALSPLERGLGSNGTTCSLQGHMRYGAIVSRLPLDAATLSNTLRRVSGSVPDDFNRHMFTPPLVEVLSRRAARTPARLASSVVKMFAFIGTFGAEDMLSICALDVDRRGVQVAIPFAGRPRFAPRVLHQLTRVSAHLLAAHRLRDRFAPPTTPGADGVDAVLDASGRLHHAAGDAKDSPARPRLTEAVKRVERARGHLRRTDPEEALDLWKGLTEGRWSLIDYCDSDGKRFILARRNEPGVRDPKALAPRERDVLAYAAIGHSNKYIGYLLGIAPSTVATHLNSAARKLGVRSRRALIESFGGVRFTGSAPR